MHALVLMAPGPIPADDEVQAAHERFIDELDRTNTVVLGGGWNRPAGGFAAAYLISCESLAEAGTIATTDPFMLAGVFRSEVVEWELVGVNPDAVDRSSLLYPVMTERPDMSGQYEETFHLAVPVEKVWQGFTEPGDLESWMGPTAECDVKPGGRMVFGESVEEGLVWEVDEVDEHRLLRYREGPGILPGETKVSVTFERTDTGTRVHITHSGFGDGADWLGTLEGYRLGWANSLADLELYLRTGVLAMRMFTFKSDLGVALRDSLSGPEVLAVTPDSFADKAGLKAGDIIIGLGGVAVFVLTDTWMFTRTHAAGENAEVTFVRGRERHTATAPLDAAMSM